MNRTSVESAFAKLIVIFTLAIHLIWQAPLALAEQRIVSLAPSITETLFILGAGSDVVGVTRYCDFPDAAKKLPRLGGPHDLNIEALISLKPSLVLTLGEHAGLTEKLKLLSVRTISTTNESLDEIFDSITTIGAAISQSSNASRLIESLSSKIELLKAKSKTRKPIRAMVIVGRSSGDEQSGIFVAGQNSVYNDLLSIVGVTNVFEKLSGYPQISAESILLSKPEIIFDVSVRAPSSENWLSKMLPNTSLYHLGFDYMYSPGPRIVQAASAFDDAITKHLAKVGNRD